MGHTVAFFCEARKGVALKGVEALPEGEGGGGMMRFHSGLPSDPARSFRPGKGQRAIATATRALHGPE